MQTSFQVAAAGMPAWQLSTLLTRGQERSQEDEEERRIIQHLRFLLLLLLLNHNRRSADGGGSAAHEVCTVHHENLRLERRRFVVKGRAHKLG